MVKNISDRSKAVLQVAILSVVLVTSFMGFNYLSSLKTVRTASLVRFEVEASGGFASITLRAGNVNMTEPTNVSAPWSQTVKIKSGTTVFLTASNPSVTGEVTCRILLDREIWKTETISSPKNGVACAGIIP